MVPNSRPDALPVPGYQPRSTGIAPAHQVPPITPLSSPTTSGQSQRAGTITGIIARPAGCWTSSKTRRAAVGTNQPQPVPSTYQPPAPGTYASRHSAGYTGCTCAFRAWLRRDVRVAPIPPKGSAGQSNGMSSRIKPTRPAASGQSTTAAASDTPASASSAAGSSPRSRSPRRQGQGRPALMRWAGD